MTPSQSSTVCLMSAMELYGFCKKRLHRSLVPSRSLPVCYLLPSFVHLFVLSFPGLFALELSETFEFCIVCNKTSYINRPIPTSVLTSSLSSSYWMNPTTSHIPHRVHHPSHDLSVLTFILQPTQPHCPSIFYLLPSSIIHHPPSIVHLPLYEVCFSSVLSPTLHHPSSWSIIPDDMGLTVLDMCAHIHSSTSCIHFNQPPNSHAHSVDYPHQSIHFRQASINDLHSTTTMLRPERGGMKRNGLERQSLRRSVSEGDFSSGRGYSVYPFKGDSQDRLLWW